MLGNSVFLFGNRTSFPSGGAAMQDLAQQIVSGLATGSIIASLALALVLIYRSMGVINYAQGEMAMFSTYIAWQLAQQGLPLWAAFAITVVAAFVGAVALEWVVIRPVERAGPLTVVVVTLGLFITLNGVAGWIWGYVVSLPDAVFARRRCASGRLLQQPGRRDHHRFAGALGAITLLFQRTKLGLCARGRDLRRVPASLGSG